MPNVPTEAVLRRLIEDARKQPAPTLLGDAMNHAVFPGGARIRPTIVASVAAACGAKDREKTAQAAAALELIHCASLVHDDLPCFDDADFRRDKQSVHKAYGEALAVLTGDSLIFLAFESLAQLAESDPVKAGRLIRVLTTRCGMPFGICAGQGWESESEIDLKSYHMSKTGALFIAATQMGAIVGGLEPEPWTDLGALIGEAFQVADDLKDAIGTEEQIGKPVHQDERNGRPNAVAQYGVEGAYALLDDILAGAIASIPACPGEADLALLVRRTADQIVPKRQSIPGE